MDGWEEETFWTELLLAYRGYEQSGCESTEEADLLAVSVCRMRYVQPGD